MLAIKENVELFPWVDAVYGCDAAWWKNCNGLYKFSGLKIAYEASGLSDYRDIRIVDVRRDRDEILMDTPGVIGSGGNSGFQAFNLALQFGASRVLLVGFDMHDRNGVHWYGRNNGPGRNNPSEDNFRRWRAAFAAAALMVEALGVDVVNASPISDLQCFRRMTIEQVLVEWRL